MNTKIFTIENLILELQNGNEKMFNDIVAAGKHLDNEIRNELSKNILNTDLDKNLMSSDHMLNFYLKSGVAPDIILKLSNAIHA